jgi:hypothetical protein
MSMWSFLLEVGVFNHPVCSRPPKGLDDVVLCVEDGGTVENALQGVSSLRIYQAIAVG